MLFALVILAADAAPATAYPDPLAPAASGQVQCYVPSDHKTCQSIATYTATGDGSFANGASVLISTTPVVVLNTITNVIIKNGAVCGQIRAEDLNAGTLTVGGNQLTKDQADPILARLVAAMAKVIGPEICTTYVPNATGLTAKATIAGEAQTGQDQQVIWVSPSDGYAVAPQTIARKSKNNHATSLAPVVQMKYSLTRKAGAGWRRLRLFKRV